MATSAPEPPPRRGGTGRPPAGPAREGRRAAGGRAGPQSPATSGRARSRPAGAPAEASPGDSARHPAGGHPGERAGWLGGGRSGRGLYDRTRQRRHEQWTAGARAASWLFARPELVLAAFGSPPPVEVGGRVLHRGVQALLKVLDRLPGAQENAWGPGADVELARRRMRQTARFTTPLRTDVYSSGRLVPGPEGSPPIPIRIYRRFGAAALPPAPLPPAIVYFHGGGWCVGDVEGYEPLCRLLAAVTRCTVVSVDYRLAPEHAFPAAVDDCLAAYQWVQRHAADLGVAEGRVAVMGDSAGGNLAAVVSLLTRPGGRGAAPDVPPPIVQGLVYPGVDLRMGTDSHRDLSVGYILTRDGMEWFRECYVPDRAAWTSPEASPLLAEDHRGLAPALVVTSGFDPLRDEGAAYAAALRDAGVSVVERCYDDQVHGFLSMGVVPDCLALSVEVFDTMGRMVRGACEAAA